VNWIRLKETPKASARVLIARVLANPGNPSNLMAQMQQQEEQTQQYYSPHPKKDREQQRNMWNFLPKEQQQFMRRLFGKPEKDQEVEEDW